MFRQQSARGTEAAKRMVSTLLENTGLVCGSIKDTLSEKDVDMEWINNEFTNAKNMAANAVPRGLKACRMGEKDLQSPETVEGRVFFEENSFVEGHGGEIGSSAVDEEEGMSESSPKRSGRVKQRSVREGDEGTVSSAPAAGQSIGAHTLVIGLCLSRRDATLGHPDTVTRQTAFDFNELQDRDYKFVSSTDSSGWLAGGGEKGKRHSRGVKNTETSNGDSIGFVHSASNLASKSFDSEGAATAKLANQKIAAPDQVHIPIIQINAESSAVVDEIISSLARGEVFIPHVSILPEALSVNGRSPPDLVVRFDCEKNDDANPEDWPNWCLEFLHNQLYDCFAPMGAQWTKRPFQITLARKVKWKTVKHMNKFFAHAEQVVNTWREKGPQYLQPPESTSVLGATREEIARPHGIYLMRNGVPTNYFAPNFQPPYTTKMTRSLIRNVIYKSWDSKRRDWLSEPIPRMGGPARFISTVLGCATTDGGALSPVESNAVFHLTHDLESFDLVQDNRKAQILSPGKRTRKDTIDTNPTDSLLKLAYSPRSTPREDVINHAAPSDESFGMSPILLDTESIEETATESITDVPTQSSVESMTPSITKRPKEEHIEQQLFSPVLSPQRKSPKRTVPPERQVIEEEEPISGEDENENYYADQQKRNPYMKVVDSKAEKFAKTKSKRREMRDRRQDDNTPSSKISPRRPDMGWQQTNLPSPSCESASMSLAYSLDDSTFFRGPAATLANISHNDGGSVLTMGTENQSLLSYVTRSTMVQSRIEATVTNDDADDISLSLLESKSSIVPTDDELLAIGWAKALDPNSGLYYYFTLDRSKTVWENPLSSSP